VKFDSGEIYDT